jgi:tRNA threonylcarbamoyladenosine biosynthesis protein TsaE
MSNDHAPLTILKDSGRPKDVLRKQAMTDRSYSMILPDPEATDRVGTALGHALRPGDTVLLHGALGAGKSALARAAIRARAGADTEVPSPTYTLVQSYAAPGLVLVHADLYRLADPAEVVELGLDVAFREDAVLVEWPEKLGPWRPSRALSLHLEPLDLPAGEGRRLTATPEGDGWEAVLRALGVAA